MSYESHFKEITTHHGSVVTTDFAEPDADYYKQIDFMFNAKGKLAAIYVTTSVGDCDLTGYDCERRIGYACKGRIGSWSSFKVFRRRAGVLNCYVNLLSAKEMDELQHKLLETTETITTKDGQIVDSSAEVALKVDDFDAAVATLPAYVPPVDYPEVAGELAEKRGLNLDILHSTVLNAFYGNGKTLVHLLESDRSNEEILDIAIRKLALQKELAAIKNEIFLDESEAEYAIE